MIAKGQVALLVFLISSLLATSRAIGQDALPDSGFVAKAMAQAVDLYEEAMNRQFMLYNGSEYNPFPEPYEEFPYFGSEYWEEGSVKYYGNVYDDVAMQYDLINDLLVIEHYDQSGYMAEVALHSEKVDYFRMLGHTFVRIGPDAPEGDVLRPGFYDLLYDGPNKILCKRRKTVHEEIESGALKVRFLERSNLFLVRDGQVFPLKSKRSLLKILADKRRLLNQFVRREVTDFRNKEKLLVDMVRYYDSLE